MLSRAVAIATRGAIRGVQARAAAPSRVCCTRMTHSLPPAPVWVEGGLPGLFSEGAAEMHRSIHVDSVKVYNELIEGTTWENRTIEEAIVDTLDDSDNASIYYNGSEAWNHQFFFESLTKGGVAPSAEMKARIADNFGSVENLQDQIAVSSQSLFGNAWIWIVEDDAGEMGIVACHGSGNPIALHVNPLLAIDLWEHAYLMDFKTNKEDYLEQVWANLDWSVIENRSNFVVEAVSSGNGSVNEN